MSHPEELIDLQIKINLTPEEKISCQYDYSRGYTCIIDNFQTRQSRFLNVDLLLENILLLHLKMTPFPHEKYQLC